MRWSLRPFSISLHNTRLYLGIALGRKGDLDAAIGEFNRVISENPDDATAYGDLGHALLLKKDTARAIPELEHALRLQPDFPIVENDLAWAYLTAEDVRLRNPIAALRLGRHAVATWDQPGARAAVLDTLAEALFQNGFLDEALRTEQQAVQLDPGNAEMKARLERIRKGQARH